MIAVIPFSGRGESKQDHQEAHQPDKSELEIKAEVRERDGFKCRDCGITNEEHLEKTGRELDVHRLVPGVVYRAKTSVTLCRTCHGKKPKKQGDALWCDDLRWIMFNLYDPADAALFERLNKVAAGRQVHWSELVQTALDQFVQGCIEHEKLDAVLMADGLE